MQTLYRQQTFLTVRPIWRRRRRFPVALPFVLSSVFLAFGGQRLFDQRDLDLNGVAAKAVVIGRHAASGPAGRSEILYRFTAGGRQYEAASGVTSDLYRRTKSGDPIDVQYLPDAPDLSRCAQATEYRQVFLLCGIGAALVFASLALRRSRVR